jgi:hypothetical protein
VDNLVGVNILPGKNPVGIYPNPARSTVNFTTQTAVRADIVLFNSLGSEMLRMPGQMIDKGYRLDVSGLKKGLYFLHLTGEALNQTLKLMIE